MAWIVVASGVAIATSDASSGVPPVARWVLGSLLLAVAGAVMSQIVADRRAMEERLREEIAEKARISSANSSTSPSTIALTGLPNRRRFEQELSVS